MDKNLSIMNNLGLNKYLVFVIWIIFILAHFKIFTFGYVIVLILVYVIFI